MNTHRKSVPAAEPVLTTAGITAAAAAVIALIVAFGVDLSDVQTEAILGVVAVAAPLVVIVARRWVTPNARVVEQEKDGVVVAGAGHEAIGEGEEIRLVGTLPDPPATTTNTAGRVKWTPRENTTPDA